MATKEMTSLSERLNHAIELTGISQAELARQLNIKPQAIQYLCSSNAQTSRFTFEIAQVLGVNSEWLAIGAGPIFPENDPYYILKQQFRPIPLIEWEHAKAYYEGALELDKVSQWAVGTHLASEKAFAVKVSDRSMANKFDKNTIIVIDPTQQPQDNDFVLVYIANEEIIVFRQFIREKEKITLEPLNTNLHKPIIISQGDIIIGTIIESYWHR